MTFCLQKLTLKNFRQFRELEIDFDESLTVLSALNGGGKSTLVDAVAASLDAFVSGMLEELPLGIEARDLRRIRAKDGSMELAGPASVEAVARVGSRPVAWSVLRKSAGRGSKGYYLPAMREIRESAEHHLQQVRDHASGKGSAPSLPILCVYGTHRLTAWEPSPSGADPKGEVTSRLRGYDGALSPSVNFLAFRQWFKGLSEQELIEMMRRRRRGESATHKRPAGERLDAVRAALSSLLQPTGWDRLSWDFEGRTVVAEHPHHGVLPVAQLSDGIKGVLALAADIAHRCVRLNPQLGGRAPAETTGIVVIDEVDLFLHPQWQQTIIDGLRESFPKIQLILTTHSPQVLSTVKAEHIRVVRVDDDGAGTFSRPTQQTRGVESADVLAAVMDVDPVPRVPESKLLSDYRALISDGLANGPEAQALRVRLEEHFGPQHPVMLDCERLIRFQAFRVRTPPGPETSNR